MVLIVSVSKKKFYWNSAILIWVWTLFDHEVFIIIVGV